MSQYKVIKQGLSTTGWVGEYVSHFDGVYIILYFKKVNRERKYKVTSLERVTDEIKEEYIVVKDSSHHRPKTYAIHRSEEEARKEAIRLAQANPNNAFSYYKRCATVKYKTVTSYELEETK